MSVIELVAYVVAQLVGGFLGGGAALILEGSLPGGNIGFPALGAGVGVGSALVAEAAVTFALCHVVLHVATTSQQANNSYYGLAIGFTVLSGAVSVGGVSGGAFNPAVGLALPLLKGHGSDVWIYVLGPLLGAALAAELFSITHPHELAEGSRGLCARGSRSLCRSQEAGPFFIEFIGTFYLAFTVACAAAPSNAGGLAPLAIGSALMAQVFAGGATSGAQYNPAVTIGIYVRRALATYSVGAACVQLKEQFSGWTAIGYIVVQCLGALVGGSIARLVLFDQMIGFPQPASDIGPAFVAELMATFLLVTTVLQVS